jgi:serine/threonine-protein kinase
MRSAAWSCLGLGVLLVLASACGDASSDGEASSPEGDAPGSPYGGALGGDGGAGNGNGSTAGGGGGASSSDASTSGGSAADGSTGGSSSAPALFPASYVFNEDVSALPAAPQSAAILATLPTFGSAASPYFDITFDFHVEDADATAPRATAQLDWADESDTLPFPVVPGGALEDSTGYQCPRTSSDCHLIVIDHGSQRLFELYAASEDSSGNWLASAEAVWDLTKSYGPHERGFGCTSADAAGLPILPGLIRVREIAVDREIRHALRFILPNARMRARSFVAPASHYGAPGSADPNAPPYGVRLRLKASFDETRVATPGGRIVVRALKRYGMILADGGNVPLTAELDDRTPEKYGADLGAHDLRAIQPSDFDVVELGQVQTFPSRPGCTLGQ